MKRLHVDSITKSFDNKVLLSDVFISCGIGEIKGLLGRNGCGKSTLLKIIFGVENADSRFVRVGKKVIQNISQGRSILNYLPQENFLPKNVKIKFLINLLLIVRKYS
ncbi:ATP-binding cassette domain-containing protein [Maribacter sp.]|uniref:ATP-binding cassette domain-containing protein n=1 Tax=Maribacter sp. TaxID=1897614 RepID=UPI0025BCDF7F|nr:ATP-binding cassette domain-containing protein [Maribacter sp.]